MADEAGYFEAAGRYVPNLLNVLQQAMTHERPVTDGPAVLGAITAPVAALLGSDTKPFFTIRRAMSSTTSQMRECTRSPASGTPPP